MLAEVFFRIVRGLLFGTVGGFVGFALSLALTLLLAFGIGMSAMDTPGGQRDTMSAVGMIWGMLLAPAMTLIGFAGGVIYGLTTRSRFAPWVNDWMDRTFNFRD